MKYIAALIVLLSMAVSAASAASGSTSTGSTSTGSTSSGVVVAEKTCATGLPCAGGPARGFNLTTKQWDMIPQCFPYTWLVQFYKGNIFDIYINQNKCRSQRFIDFGI